MTYITASDGVRLFLSEEGPREAPTILFAHEFGGDWRTWDAQVTRFAGEYRCLRYCARGFDPSEVPSEVSSYGQARATADLRDIAEALDIDCFHLVGCSMGSYTALMFALEEQQRIKTLTLIGCSSGPRGEEERRRYRAALHAERDLLASRGGDGAVEWFASDPAYRRLAIKAPDRWRDYLDRLQCQSVHGAMRTLETLHWRRDSLFEQQTQLRRLKVPTLVLHGSEDHELVRPTADLLAESLSCVRCLAVPDAGHLVHIEEPELFNSELAQHLRSS